jgi:hypothetical protein
MLQYVQAFMALIQLLNQLIGWANQMGKDSAAQWIQDLGAAFADIRNSKSPEDMNNAAKKLQNVLSGG